MRDVKTTSYWQPLKARRNVAVYIGEFYRITVELNPVHVEFRLKGAGVIRKEGIASPKDLLVINPGALFAKHIWWSDFGARYVKKIVRQEVAKARETYRGKKVLCDSYRAHIPTYVRTVLHNNHLDRSQVLKDGGQMNKRREKPIEPPFAMRTIVEFK
jgi:hypothetical protein